MYGPALCPLVEVSKEELEVGGSPEGSRHHFPDGFSGSDSGCLRVAHRLVLLLPPSHLDSRNNFAFSLADGGELSTDGEFCNKIRGTSQIRHFDLILSLFHTAQLKGR